VYQYFYDDIGLMAILAPNAPAQFPAKEQGPPDVHPFPQSPAVASDQSSMWELR
jgi:hypothetical protein